MGISVKKKNKNIIHMEETIYDMGILNNVIREEKENPH